MITRKDKLGSTDIISLISLYLCAIFYFEVNLYKICLWGLIPISFLLSFLRHNTITRNPYLRIIIVLFTWCCITFVTALDTEIAAKELQSLAGVFLFCYISATLAAIPKARNWLLGVYLVLLINCIVYAYNNLLDIVVANTGARLSDENLNANMFGYLLLSATFITFYWGCISKGYARRISNLLFLAIIPISFILALLTASRQILILEIPMIGIYLFLRYWKPKAKIFLSGVVILSVAGYVGFEYVTKYYDESELSKRSQVRAIDDPRVVLIKDAIRIGCENPITGVGPGNFRLLTPEGCFSHNSYLELFANNGLLASVIYIMLICRLIRRAYLARRKGIDNTVANCFLVYGIFYAIDNVFYVFYINPWLLSFFVSAATIANSILKPSKRHISLFMAVRNNQKTITA